MGKSKVGNCRAGILHQSEGVDAEALAGGAIDFAHFGRGNGLHETTAGFLPNGRGRPSPHGMRLTIFMSAPLPSVRADGVGLAHPSRLIAKMITPRSWRMRELSIVFPANEECLGTEISPISRSMPR